MSVVAMKPEDERIEASRERIYGFLATLFSHPDEGMWGRVLRGGEQRAAIAAADRLRALVEDLDYPLGEDELGSGEIDLRCLVLELCQPLEHLKSEFERILGPHRLGERCLPCEFDHRRLAPVADRAESLADLASLYRSFEFGRGDRLPRRPDHITFELGFMNWLLGRKRVAGCLASLDPDAADQSSGCDLAQRHFFGDHLARWVTSLAVELQHNPGGGYFEPLGRFLAAWVPLERHHLELDARFETIPGGHANVAQTVGR